MTLRETRVEGEISTPTTQVRLEAYRWDRPSEIDYRIPEYAIFKTLAPMPSCSRVGPVSARRWTADFEGLGFWPAETPLHFMTSRPALRVLFCRFPRERLQALTGFGSGWDIGDLEGCFGLDNPRIDTATLRLAEEVLEPGFGAPLIAEGIGMAIMIELARHFRQQREPALRKGGLTSLQLRRITEQFREGETRCPTVAELAQACGISERHLLRAFKETTGLTIGRYFEMLRTERAKALLQQTLSIKEIGFRLGFHSASHFSTAFRKAMGTTPSAYRRVIRA